MGWFVEGKDARGFTWTMQPRGGDLSLSEQKKIAMTCAAVLRRLAASGSVSEAVSA